MRKKIIGFDLDGIFIDRPFFIPKKLIERLYRDHCQQKLIYRIPSSFEQKIRRITHLPFVRPPIGKNCGLIKKLKKEGKYDFYLISGRFGFLEDLTYAWLEKYQLKDVFAKIYFSKGLEQPHLFKERILKKLTISIFIDDDYDCLAYLAKRIPKIRFYCYTKTGKVTKENKKVRLISDLDLLLR